MNQELALLVTIIAGLITAIYLAFLISFPIMIIKRLDKMIQVLKKEGK